jgi:tetratricopeptide (TPR) repeat protein
MADPGEQLAKVLAFRKKLEATRQVLYHAFDDEASFVQEIDKHLVAYAKDECGTRPPGSAPILPDSVQAAIDAQRLAYEKAINELELMKQKAQQEADAADAARAAAKTAEARAAAAEQASAAKAETDALIFAESAAKAALDGRIEEARQTFSKVLDSTANLQILYLGYDFYKRIGDLDEAERLLKRWLAISGPDAQTANTAAAYSNLGLVLQARGDLDGAEAMYRKGLTIDEALGRREGIASEYGNLGLVLQVRGDLDGAEAMYRKALAIDEKLGRQEGVGSHYGNLGIVLKKRGDVDGAEAMYREALAIDEKLGSLEGMATDNQNLGILAEERKQFAEARRLWTLARDQHAKLGVKQRAEELQSWLDELPPDDA